MNVDKEGSKNISVILGKVLDMRVGHRGLCTNVTTDRGECGKRCRQSGQSLVGGGGKLIWGPFSSAVNNQLRTGADKGDPPV